MAYEQKDNSGTMFKNDKKEQDTHADYNGSIKVAGVEYWLNCWVNKPEGKKPYLSVSVKPKEQRAPQSPPAQGVVVEDDLPF